MPPYYLEFVRVAEPRADGCADVRGVEAGLRVKPCVFPAVDDALHVPVELRCEVVVIRDKARPEVWVVPEHLGREPAAAQLALSVLRRHEHHELFNPSGGKGVQLRRIADVVPVFDVEGVGVLREVDEAPPGELHLRGAGDFP